MRSADKHKNENKDLLSNKICKQTKAGFNEKKKITKRNGKFLFAFEQKYASRQID